MPSYLTACWRTAFLAGFALGTEISAGLGGEFVVCGGLWPGFDEENLDEMLENHDHGRFGEPPWTLRDFSEEPEPLRAKPGRVGVMGFGLAAGVVASVVAAVSGWPLGMDTGAAGGDGLEEGSSGGGGGCWEGAVLRRWPGFVLLSTVVDGS